jgi:hypothetical protein
MAEWQDGKRSGEILPSGHSAILPFEYSTVMPKPTFYTKPT